MVNEAITTVALFITVLSLAITTGYCIAHLIEQVYDWFNG
jgi:hypothetical protein